MNAATRACTRRVWLNDGTTRALQQTGVDGMDGTTRALQ
jgi:hypothetical protein